MPSQSQKYDVLVLGAGVIGLSSALDLVEAGYRVAVAAKDLPEDSFSTGFASPWAGCNWHTFEDDGSSPAAKRDARTYARLAKVAATHPHLCKRIEFVDVFSTRVPAESRWNNDLVGGICEVTRDTYPIPGGHPHAHIWNSYIIHAPKYILHLASLLRSKNVPIVRTRLSSLDEAYDIPSIGPVSLVVNATGLGSFSLIGVEDPKAHPARGQTVLVRAPRAKRCIMNTESFMGDDDAAKPAYIIPRPGCDEVVLGGTYIPNNHSSLPDLVEADRILQACFDLEPLLAPQGGGWRDIEVISHNVGLRPARDGGARVELEKKVVGSATRRVGRPNSADKKQVGVVHAYGFGSAGFQASLGAAEEVVQLTNEYFGKPNNAILQGRQAKL
ncbi:hypothetical protein DB88DRAFT_501974 [Papiliotrema laurentii]|uniref:FAD dependent oxidoreductase domain-containing protein n=1 Tax=Papiliotrema laurentii TaxID=5418 RepID=A0AAD9CV08_PAPLA|nr:hypothetical protein DB88DRAFT_501974 [Papiliotrema laurentii]